NAGTRTAEGRWITLPITWDSSSFVTAFGDVTFTGPWSSGSSMARSSTLITSSRCTQETTWRPEAMGPPTNNLNGLIISASAPPPEDDAEPRADDAHTERLGAGRSALPRDGHLRQKIRARGRSFVERLVAVGAVVADGGRAHEDRGPRRGFLHELDEALRTAD